MISRTANTATKPLNCIRDRFTFNASLPFSTVVRASGWDFFRRAKIGVSV